MFPSRTRPQLRHRPGVPVGLLTRSLRPLILLICAAGAYRAGAAAWADYLSRRPDLPSREDAARGLPSPQILERLAEKREETGGDALPALKRAAELDPANAARWLRLGLRAEAAGDLATAERALLTAADLSRLYLPRYSLAQYYFRRGNADLFEQWSARAFETSYGDVTPLIDLAWRLRPDPAAAVARGLAQRREVARQYLEFLVRRNETAAAGSLAAHIAETAVRDDLWPLAGYCNLALAEGSPDGPVAVWNHLCRKGILPYPALDVAAGRSLGNPDFAGPPLNAGFDWNVAKPSGVHITRLLPGLGVVFSGHQAEFCVLGWAYVPVQAGRRYALSLDSEVNEGSGPPGLAWGIADTRGAAVPSGTGFETAATFKAPAPLLRIALLYRRAPGVPRFEGRVTIRRIRLEMAPQ